MTTCLFQRSETVTHQCDKTCNLLWSSLPITCVIPINLLFSYSCIVTVGSYKDKHDLFGRSVSSIRPQIW